MIKTTIIVTITIITSCIITATNFGLVIPKIRITTTIGINNTVTNAITTITLFSPQSNMFSLSPQLTSSPLLMLTPPSSTPSPFFFSPLTPSSLKLTMLSPSPPSKSSLPSSLLPPCTSTSSLLSQRLSLSSTSSS